MRGFTRTLLAIAAFTMMASLPSPVAAQVTGWYPDYDTSWTDATCLYGTIPSYSRPTYSTNLACCKGAYAGQVTGTCLAAIETTKCFDLAWTNTAGTGTATGKLLIDSTLFDSSGYNEYQYTPAAFPYLSVTIAGAGSGNGTFELGLADFFNVIFELSGPTNLDAEIVAQGTLVNFNVAAESFSDAPQETGSNVMVVSEGTGADEFTIATITPCVVEPEYPVIKSDKNCQDAIAKAGAQYFAKRHKALSKCRSDLLNAKPLFEDVAQTIPVVAASKCKDEYKTAGTIAKERQKARLSIEKRCTDAILGTLKACSTTIDGLARMPADGQLWYPDYDTPWSEATCLTATPIPPGRPTYSANDACCKGAYAGQVSGVCLAAASSSGCLIDSVDNNVDRLLVDQYGY